MRPAGRAVRRRAWRGSWNCCGRAAAEAGGRWPQLADDPLVAGLLLLHDLHPLDVDARIQRALDRVRPYLGSHAGGVEFLGVDRRRRPACGCEGSCDGCPSSTVTVELAIERRRRGRRAGGRRGRRRGRGRDAEPSCSRSPLRARAAARRRERGRTAGGWILLPDIGPPSSRPVSAPRRTRRAGLRRARHALRLPRLLRRLRLVHGRRAARRRGADLPGLRRGATTSGWPARASTDPALHLDPLPLLADATAPGRVPETCAVMTGGCGAA